MMQHYIFTEKIQQSYRIAILIKDAAFTKTNLFDYYVKYLNPSQVIAFNLPYNSEDKIPVSFAKEYLESLRKMLIHFGIEILLVADSAYFKTLTKVKKVEPNHGYILDCKLKGYEQFKAIVSINYKALFHNPDFQSRLDLSLNTLNQYLEGNYRELGTNVIHHEYYPKTPSDIFNTINSLYHYSELTCDIETYGLEIGKGIGTIAFAWNQHEGVAFDVNISNEKALKQFFENYTGTLIFHNASFDIKHIIYELFMDGSNDIEGMLYGLDVMYKDTQDTKIISYLATNSCAGNNLSLKYLAFEYTGNYAVEEINDITKIPKDELLRYNLIDTLGTWYVFNLYFPTMLRDEQYSIYTELMLPSLKVITQMELTGMCLDIQETISLNKELTKEMDTLATTLSSNPIVKEVENLIRLNEQVLTNSKLKKKVKPLSDFEHITFNPKSNKHVRELLYTYLDLPILDTTDTGLPAVGAKTLKKLKQHILNYE